MIMLRQIYIRTYANDFIPNEYILISDGAGAAYWNSISSIYPARYNVVKDPFGSTLEAAVQGNILNVSTMGVQGLFEAYADASTSSLILSNAAPPVQVALNSVPAVTRLAAELVPSPQTLTMSTGQSTLKFIGVGDIQLSTVTDLRAVFVSISSFTASGYADLSAEARAWRGYVYSTNSTSAGYATFLSSIPYSTVFTNETGSFPWNWTDVVGSNLPLSTVEAYPDYYSTGDVYFSTVSFNMAPYLQYIQPNSTTKMFLEVQPNYYFQRMYLGTSTPYNLVKEFSSFVQYESARGRQILATAATGGQMVSQMSNAYTSNYFNTPLKLELNPHEILSNVAQDGTDAAIYTLYHRIPGAMANLVSDGYCGYVIGPRGGFSNPTLTYDNRTALANTAFLQVYNQQGAAAPMPGP